MTDLDDLKQKAEGEIDKVKGKIKQQSDDPIKQVEGHWDELKGNIKEKTADLDDEE